MPLTHTEEQELWDDTFRSGSGDLAGAIHGAVTVDCRVMSLSPTLAVEITSDVV